MNTNKAIQMPNERIKIPNEIKLTRDMVIDQLLKPGVRRLLKPYERRNSHNLKIFFSKKHAADLIEEQDTVIESSVLGLPLEIIDREYSEIINASEFWPEPTKIDPLKDPEMLRFIEHTEGMVPVINDPRKDIKTRSELTSEEAEKQAKVAEEWAERFLTGKAILVDYPNI